MKRFTPLLVTLMLFACALHTVAADNDQKAVDKVATNKARLAELNAYWARVSRAVNTGDFDSYKSTCHKQGILVSTAGKNKTSQPLSQALARWKKEFDSTKAGKMKASVTFRFAQRVGDATTAHETGIFLYTQFNAEGKRIQEYIHFEGLLIKKNSQWTILMEYQKSKATKKEWEGLKPEKKKDK